MLKDLSRGNQILYYLTSMSLSIVLFLLKVIYDNFKNNKITQFQVIMIVIAIVVALLIASYILYKSIKGNYNSKGYYEQDDYDSSNFSMNNISDINGQPVSFLISNVTSVYFISSFPIPSSIAFFVIHLLLFVMMIKGENLQPNPFLFLYGIDIYKTKDNDFLINLNNRGFDHNNILKMNDSKNVRTYIIGNLEKSLSDN
ncbi:MAG: hypothetical protein ACTIH2_04270 [Anaerococcus sp.]